MSAYRDMATDAGYTGDEAAEAARVLEEQHREESDRTCRDCDEREPMSDYGTNAQGVVSAQAGQIMALEAEVKGLREALHSEATRLHQTARDAVRYQDERNEARAEVERLRAALRALHNFGAALVKDGNEDVRGVGACILESTRPYQPTTTPTREDR